jgi:threonyl-tRNA synthetase
MKRVYGIFGYEFSLMLSTRPDNYLGELEVWDKAEATLVKVLTEFGHPFAKDEGGGAFYGPKIDVKIQDSLGRQHQCATVQLDFQLPIRFGLEYVGKEKNEVLRPVIIHRAIYGSLERFIGILIEHLVSNVSFSCFSSPHLSFAGGQVAAVAVAAPAHDCSGGEKVQRLRRVGAGDAGGERLLLRH